MATNAASSSAAVPPPEAEAEAGDGVAAADADADDAAGGEGAAAESTHQQRLQRLSRQANDALRGAFALNARPARAQLEAAAQSATKADSLATQGATLRSRPRAWRCSSARSTRVARAT